MKDTEIIRTTDKIMVPISQKLTLTVDEAVAYTGIGSSKIRELIGDSKCPFVLNIGKRKLIKRKEFEKYISNSLYI